MPIIDNELRVGDRVTEIGLGLSQSEKGTVREIDDRKMFPVTVEWDDGEFITGHRRDQLLRVYYEEGTMGPSEAIKKAFAYREGEEQETPDMETIEKAFEAVVFRLNAQRVWADRIRRLVKNSPQGVNVNYLIGLSNSLEEIEKAIAYNEDAFRQKMRLALRGHVAELL